MKKETNFETSPLNTQDAKAEAATTLAPDATNGDKIKALRTAQHMSMAELARRASMSDRAMASGLYSITSLITASTADVSKKFFLES